jgi:hypothetical protein
MSGALAGIRTPNLLIRSRVQTVHRWLLRSWTQVPIQRNVQGCPARSGDAVSKPVSKSLAELLITSRPREVYRRPRQSPRTRDPTGRYLDQCGLVQTDQGFLLARLLANRILDPLRRPPGMTMLSHADERLGRTEGSPAEIRLSWMVGAASLVL